MLGAGAGPLGGGGALLAAAVSPACVCAPHPVLGAGGGFGSVGVAVLGGAVLSAGTGSAGCSDEDEPVKEPNQRLTRLPLLALSPVSPLAVVVHCPEVAVRVGVSGAGAAPFAWALGP